MGASTRPKSTPLQPPPNPKYGIWRRQCFAVTFPRPWFLDGGRPGWGLPANQKAPPPTYPKSKVQDLEEASFYRHLIPFAPFGRGHAGTGASSRPKSAPTNLPQIQSTGFGGGFCFRPRIKKTFRWFRDNAPLGSLRHAARCNRLLQSHYSGFRQGQFLHRYVSVAI